VLIRHNWSAGGHRLGMVLGTSRCTASASAGVWRRLDDDDAAGQPSRGRAVQGGQQVMENDFDENRSAELRPRHGRPPGDKEQTL
jgi:hypothetical protein